MVVDCLVELAHVFIDKTFSYRVPDYLEDKIIVGKRVVVPFGKQILEGFILSISYSSQDDLKEIISVSDIIPLNSEMLDLGKYIKDTYLCSLMTAYQAMLPLALKARKKIDMKIKYDKFITLNDVDLSNFKFNEKQEKIITLLKKDKVIKKELLDLTSKSSVNTLIKKGIINITYSEAYRYKRDVVEKSDFSLNDDQLNVYNEVINGFGKDLTYLLYGVTGSGKTNVYIKIIEEVIKIGKTAIMLVPEISLTPQIIDRFYSRFSRIAVLHSGLSDSEKYDEWRKIYKGEVDIVVGARSAIFAPLKNIGVIIIDEEHSDTYKQDNNPRYDAIDIALWRSKYHKAPVILGSATPRLESYARAKKGVYKLLTLDKRHNDVEMPTSIIVDMNKEFKKSNSYYSNILLDKIRLEIKKGNQVILFLNRRGYSTTLMCPSCGEAVKCPNCDITLTYHKSSNMLRCHYCGYAKVKDKYCKCGEELREFGYGTEKAMEELSSLVSDAKIIRMDVDTTTKKNSHENIIKSFQNKEYNVLIGTQMIAKGLDFPSVTLVGILNADISLNFPDFRASEETFQIINQVSGRSGRKVKGEVVIQTFNPLHYALRYSKDNDYIGFYNEEMKIRKKLSYPPFYYLCMIRVVSSDYNKASEESIKISKLLRSKINNSIILGPSVANIFKLNNKYRFQIIIKYKNVLEIIDTLRDIEEHYFNNKDIKLEITFNPRRL